MSVPEIIEVFEAAPEVVSIEAMPPLHVEVVTRGPQGVTGAPGIPGEPGDSELTDPGDLTLLFDNRLI